MSRKSSRQAEPFLGSWRIVETEMWDLEDLDVVEDARITFGRDGLGELRFLAIGASIDYRIGKRDGDACIEFSWAGYDEGEPASGRGWGRIDSGVMRGTLFIHQGDESTFVAHRAMETGRPSAPPRRHRGHQPRRAQRSRRG